MTFRKNLISAAVLMATSTLMACSDSDKDELVNTAPTAVSLSEVTVAENSVAAVIGTLTATDDSDEVTFSIDDDRFVISGSELMLAPSVSLDFETEQSVELDITATDSEGLSYTQTITISVTDIDETVAATYSFSSKFIDGQSSVSYSGQTARHALIAELNHYIGNQLQADLDNSVLLTRDAVLAKLNKYYRTTEQQYDDFAITFIDAEQSYMTDISGSLKNLSGKIAGNDEAGQHKDWSTEFEGWGAKGSTTPEGLIDIFFGQLADNAEQYLLGNVRQAATGEDITKIYINSDGTDLKQLIQKFLLGAVNYSQATDDYLGHETPNKGLTTDNVSADGDNAYSKLEHQFDEGFGYFGAPRDYLEYTDTEIAGKVSGGNGRDEWNGMYDTDDNGSFDLKSEVVLGNASNAAKRDLGTVGNAKPTDFSGQIMQAFIAGRKIINDNAGSTLTDAQMTALKAQRDLVVDGWERAIASTVVHYINDSRADLAKFGTVEFNFADLAKHWSEMKGFALGLQFNPYSKISDADFAEIQSLFGEMPVLSSADDVEAYRADLLEARDIIETALAFDAENVENW